MTTLPRDDDAWPSMDTLLGELLGGPRTAPANAARPAAAPARPAAAAFVETGRLPARLLRLPGRRITHAELHARIEAASAALRRRGMGAGSVVLYAVRPGVDAMVLLPALLRAGATVIGLDPGVGAALLAERLKVLVPDWVVAESIVFAASAPGPLQRWLRRRGLELPNLNALDAQRIRVGPWMPGVTGAVAARSLWAAAAPPADRTPPAPALARDRPVLAIFTSGTTAAPKLVLHSSASLGATCALIGRRLALAPTDVVYSHQTHQMLPSMLAGATCIVPAALTDARRVLADIARHRVTHLYAVPFELAGVVAALERSGERLPAHLRAIVLGSAPVLPAFLARLRACCGDATEVWCAYGMSEIFPVALVESREKLAHAGGGDLVGRPVDGVQVALAADGELVVAGPHLFTGYAGLPGAATHASGDLARIDADGRIVLLGRKKDMIIRGHHNLYPALYEDGVAAIAGVEACAFVGVPQADLADERVVLAIEPRAGEDAQTLRRRVLRELADGPHAIDRYAQPDLVLVCTLPRSGRSHKLDRARLAGWAADALAQAARGHAGGA